MFERREKKSAAAVVYPGYSLNWIELKLSWYHTAWLLFHLEWQLRIKWDSTEKDIQYLNGGPVTQKLFTWFGKQVRRVLFSIMEKFLESEFVYFIYRRSKSL